MARARAVAGSGVEVAETAEVVVVMVPAKAGLAVERARVEAQVLLTAGGAA